tara:strand:- start:118 stop:411 length:294 start_codon:yes stop_codon:yes gene_type:complete
MSEDKVEVKSEDQKRGFRGEVGNGSAGSRLKGLYNKTAKAIEFKRFVRDLAKAGNVDAKQWFANKKGALDKKRSDAAIARIQLERAATKQARRKKAA